VCLFVIAKNVGEVGKLNIQNKILTEFEKGKSVVEVAKEFSTKTVYRYYKLYMLILIRNEIQRIIDKQRFDVMNLPTLKGTIKEW